MEIPQGTLDREIEITVWVARDEETRRYYLEESFLGPPLDFNLRINARSARGWFVQEIETAANLHRIRLRNSRRFPMKLTVGS